jgi:mannose-1-phosphate guanylyltransferase
VVLNGDVLSGHDLAGQVAFHREVDADVTMHLVEVDDARAYGCVPTDADGRVTAFLEKMPDPVTRWINAGAYVFRRSVVDVIPADQVVSVERETFPQLLAAGRSVHAWKQTAYWCDVGTPEALIRCSADVVNGVAPGAVPPSAPASVAADAVVAAGAVVDGGTSVGSGATVGAGCTVRRAIVMPQARIGAGARVESSIVGAAAEVGAEATLVDVVLADGAVVRQQGRPVPGSRIGA